MSREQDDIVVLDAEDEATAPTPAVSTQVYSTGSQGLALGEAIQSEALVSIVENYILYYAAGEGHTARAKRYDLQHFLLFLAGTEDRIPQLTVADWTQQQTQNFVDDRLSLGEAPATVSRRLATLKHLGRTLAERIHGYINPAREVKGPVQKVTRPHGLSEEEIAALRLAASPEQSKTPTSFTASRNQFLVELLLATGLRADEVRLLVMAQISEDRNWLKNVKTKGRRFRNVYLDTQIRELLEDYLRTRETELSSKAPELAELPPGERIKFPVLISFYHAQPRIPSSYGLSPKTVWRIISATGKRAGQLVSGPIGNLHPHRLRHTFAHGLLDSSKDVRLVAQALGHSDVRTTMRYTERSDEEIAQAIESRLSDS